MEINQINKNTDGKKIGIFTFYRYNYGAFLQAYALRQYLENLGYNAQLVYFDYSICGIPSINTHSLYSFAKTFAVSMLRYHKRKEKYKCFPNSVQKELKESQRYKSIKQLSENLNYDILLTGSDQVFNPNLAPKGYYVRMLDFPTSKNIKKASYAASIGLDKYPEKYKEDFRRCLSSFDAVSVREIQAEQIIKQYTDKKILQHIDPTFLLNKEQWETFSQDLPENINEPFIFVHILKRQPELIEFAENLSDKLGCKVLMSDQRYVFKNAIKLDKPLSPEQFIRAIMSAQYVVTNSFHGMVLSINLKQRARIFIPETAPARITDILDNFKLNRLCQDELLSLEEIKSLYSYANKKINEGRLSARKYLLSLSEL